MTIWVTSDHHFGHANILKFTDRDGNLIRPGFADVHEMNKHMTEVWNGTVNENDIVYHLGDIGFNRVTLDAILPKLKGRKRLILGNHDNFKMSFYDTHFQKVGVSRQFGKVILSHFPLHIHDGDYHSYELNIHGHIHQNESPTPRHVNVSVERWDYRPVNLEELVKDCKGFRL